MYETYIYNFAMVYYGRRIFMSKYRSSFDIHKYL